MGLGFACIPERFLQRVLSYRYIILFVYVVSMILTVGDRLWLSVTCGDLIEKRPDRCKFPIESLGLTITSTFWIISARTLIVSLNISFFTIMWVLPNIIEELAPRWMDMDVRQVNLRHHKWTGIWLNGVVAVVHVLLLFLPTIMDGIPFEFKYDGFDWNIWWDPVTRTFSSFISSEVIYMTYDEGWRIFGMILIFCIMIPISRADWMLNKSFSLAMLIHAIAGFGFMMDMIRKESHPLCWYFNLPVVGLYCMDRLIATFLYRVNKFMIYKIENCSESAFILYGMLPGLELSDQGCGDNFWLLQRFHASTPCRPKWQRAHPYTSFHNYNPETRHLWNVAFVINTNPRNKASWGNWLKVQKEGVPAITSGPNASITKKPSMKNKVSPGFDNLAFENDRGKTGKTKNQSEKMSEISDDVYENPMKEAVPEERNLRSWGPYRASFYDLHSDMSVPNGYICMVAGGTGYAYILSAIAFIEKSREFRETLLQKIVILFSSKDLGLLTSFCQLLTTVPGHELCTVRMHYTGPEHEQAKKLASAYPKFAFNYERASFNQLLAEFEGKESAVYCCGPRSMLEAVGKSAHALNFRLRQEEI